MFFRNNVASRLRAMFALVVFTVCAVLALGVLPSVDATTVRYRGSVYRGVTQTVMREGGATFRVQVSVPAFPSDEAQLRWIVAQVLSTNVRLVDEEGVILNSTANYWAAPAAVGGGDEGGDGAADVLAEWVRVAEMIGARSRVEVDDGGRELRVTLTGVDWELPPHVGVLVVPCLPFELFGEKGQVGVLDMPNNCLAGDPFMVRRAPFVHLDAVRWRARGELLVTGNPIEVPLAGAAQDTLDKFLIERDLRVVEGSTCLHTRNAFVRGSVWDMHRRVYRYTPNRGGVQTLCYTPYPETLPLLRVKLADSYEVAGPEGVSTDPPQVRAELEFVGTIFGTNLTERDTAVMTDELCSDFASQNVFFVELFFSSPTRVSFFGTFHRRGIYHVCYHRAGSSAYVRVSTLLVEKGTEIVIDSDSTNVLIDQDVKLLESATVARLKVQDKGNLDLKQRSLNVSYFVWSGGTISGKGTINCTGFGKITTQGYETRQLSVPLHNHGEMTIDVQRLLLDRDGAIHNYGNLTLAVSSMGRDGISSVLSMGRHNTINNHAGGVLRIVALDERSYALLTSRIVLWEGRVSVSGRVNVTDLSNGVLSSVVLRRGAELTTYNARLAGQVTVESRAVLSLMEGSALMSTGVDGGGVVRVLGEGVLLDSLNVSGSVSVQVGSQRCGGGEGGGCDGLSVSVYGAVVFGAQTHVDIGHATFATTTGMAKLLFHGSVSALLDGGRFGENLFVQAGGVTVLHGPVRESGALWGAHSPHDGTARRHGRFSDAAVVSADVPLSVAAFGEMSGGAAGGALVGGVSSLHGTLMSLMVPPNATFFAIDTAGLGGGSGDVGASCPLYWTMSDYVALAGRGVVRGCFGIAHGGSIGGAIEPLERREDWETAVATACRGMFGGEEGGSALCRRWSAPPAVAHSGLALGGDVYVRAPAVVRVEELVVASGTTRSVDALVLRADTRVVVRRGATLALVGGSRVETRALVVEGTLAIAEPSRTRLVANVTVAEGGVIRVATENQQCRSSVQVDGELVAPSSGSVQCQAAAAKKHEPTDSDYDAEWYTGFDVDALRRRTLAAFPSGVACPSEVLYSMEMQVRAVPGNFAKRAFVAMEAPLPRQIAGHFLLMVMWCLMILHILLRLWGISYRGFVSDLRMQPAIHPNLSWRDVSHNYFNFVNIAIIIQSTMQSCLACFHPGLPFPLVMTALISRRSMNVALSYHLKGSIHYVLSFGLIAAIFVCTAMLRSEKVPKSRLALLRGVLAFLNLVASALRTPLLSWLMDGVMCNTLLSPLPGCDPYKGRSTYFFSFLTFTVAAIVVPLSTAQLQSGYVDLYARTKVSWIFCLFVFEPLQLFIWKSGYGSPLYSLTGTLVLHVVRMRVAYKARVAAYRNMYLFVTHVSSSVFVVILAIYAHLLRVRLGWVRTCTDGDVFFKCVFVALILNGLRSFYAYIYRADYTPDTGDVTVDALQRSIQQLTSRVSEMKKALYTTVDPIERETILNSLARLRIELLEKQEHYRYEIDRLLRPFYLGARYADMEGGKTLHSARPGSTTRFGEVSAETMDAVKWESGSPSSQHGSLLTEEEMESFSCGPALGKGSYGTVHLGILANGKLVAVKYVSVVGGNREALGSVMAEVNMLRELSHPNVIRYYGAHKIDDMMLVFMEFAVGGSLTSIVRKFTGLTESVMQLYTYQILRGLEYLHSKGVVHRDIKGENILIDGYGVAKLSDFGCSKSLANIANGAEAGGGTLVGSPFWMAPEVIRSEAYGTKADIWSVGCTVVEMLNGGDPPWRDEFDNVYSAMFYVGSTNDIPQIPEETSEECLSFLHRCFERDVSKRATAEELLEHPWLQSAARQTVENGEGFLRSAVFSPASFSSSSPAASFDNRGFPGSDDVGPLQLRSPSSTSRGSSSCSSCTTTASSSVTTTRDLEGERDSPRWGRSSESSERVTATPTTSGDPLERTLTAQPSSAPSEGFPTAASRSNLSQSRGN